MFLFFSLLTSHDSIVSSLTNLKATLNLPPPISIINNSLCGLGLMMNSGNMAATSTIPENCSVLNNSGGANLHGNYL